jgi:LPXTG-motif cell wall-anchored protein
LIGAGLYGGFGTVSGVRQGYRLSRLPKVDGGLGMSKKGAVAVSGITGGINGASSAIAGGILGSAVGGGIYLARKRRNRRRKSGR